MSWFWRTKCLTPDSSRFWPRASYQPGGLAAVFDKQYVRDYLESIHWNKQPPAPALPPEVIQRDQRKIPRSLPRSDGKNALNWIDILLVLVVGFSVLAGLHGRVRSRRELASSPLFWASSAASGFTGLRPRTCSITSARAPSRI